MTPGIPQARDPIPVEAIPTIRRLLLDSPRDLALFVIGINTGLRSSDLSRLKLGDVLDDKWRIRDTLRIRQQKTHNHVNSTINDAMRDAINRWWTDNEEPLANWCSWHELSELDAHLFYTTSGHTRRYSHTRCYKKGLTPCHINKLVSKWCESAGLRGSFGGHSLRKTQGKALFDSLVSEMGEGKAMVMTAYALGHKSPETTMNYLGITKKTVERYQKGLNLGAA